MDERNQMKEEKVEYVPVPDEELQDHQIFHSNKAKTSDVEPYTGGIAAEAIGIPMIAGGKTINSVLKSKIGNALVDKLQTWIEPKRDILDRQIQGTIDPETGATGRARQTGYNATTMEQAAERAQNELRLKSLDQAKLTSPMDPIRGGPGFNASTPMGIHTTPESLKGLNLNPAVAQALEELKPLNAYERALQTVKGFGANNPIMQGIRWAANSPVAKAAGTGAGLWEGGENAVRLYNHLKNNQIGRELLDAAGVVSNVAMMAPTPFSPESNIIGAGLSIPIGFYQRKLEEEDKAQKKSTGGLANLK
jgi:hypothetical protein